MEELWFDICRKRHPLQWKEPRIPGRQMMGVKVDIMGHSLITNIVAEVNMHK